MAVALCSSTWCTLSKKADKSALLDVKVKFVYATLALTVEILLDRTNNGKIWHMEQIVPGLKIYLGSWVVSIAHQKHPLLRSWERSTKLFLCSMYIVVLEYDCSVDS